MPLYEYENKKTGERFTEHLPIHKRNFPCRDNNIRRVISAPNYLLYQIWVEKKTKRENKY